MIYGANRASSTLATALSNVATTIAINAGDAGKFPSPIGGGWFPLVIVDTSGNLEIVKCTARAASNLTVVRGQEGTAALSFSAGSRVELRLTKAAFEGIQDAAAASVSALALIVASKADESALAAEIALARDASNLNVGTVPNGQLPDRLKENTAVTWDWNNTYHNGFYYSFRQSDGTLNTPNGATAPWDGYYWMGTVIKLNSSYSYQEVVTLNAPNEKWGRWFAATWGPWFRIRHSETEQDARYAQLSGATFSGPVDVGNAGLGYFWGTPAVWARSIAVSAGLSMRDEVGVSKAAVRWSRSIDSFQAQHAAQSATALQQSGATGVWTIGTDEVHHDGNASRGVDAVLEDQKASGVPSQSCVTHSWITLDLNTEVHDPNGLVSLSANQFTVTQNGIVQWFTGSVGATSTRLWNVTDGVEAGRGMSVQNKLATGQALVSAGKTYRLELISGAAPTAISPACGRGTEIYTRIIYTRR